MHKYFLAQQDIRKKHTKLDKLDNAVLKNLYAIPDGTTEKKEIESPKKLKTTQLDLSNKIDLLVLKAFTLYQQLLSLPIRAKWDDIV